MPHLLHLMIHLMLMPKNGLKILLNLEPSNIVMVIMDKTYIMFGPHLHVTIKMELQHNHGMTK